VNVIVTCGPSFEPVDEVRRLTNFSTGETGVRLAEHLAQAGYSVLCLKGHGATFPDPKGVQSVQLFSTNEDLLARLEDSSLEMKACAVFHAAALSDFTVTSIENENGRPCKSVKISSTHKTLTIRLAPARKIVGELRRLFPDAVLVAWKYELEGDRSSALVRATALIDRNNLQACVVNGSAFGPGFGLVTRTEPLQEAVGKSALADLILRWLPREKQREAGNPLPHPRES
jgi:phosphopantothenoylcysteine synthetase/decarboxylase